MTFTFADYRRSRHLTQEEAARLCGYSRLTIARWDTRLIDAPLYDIAAVIDNELANGPHEFVSRKLLDPFTFKPLPARTVYRLPVGKVFAAFEYYQPHDAAYAALKIKRPDLAEKARNLAHKRVVTLYRVLTSRYTREQKNAGFGVELVDMREAQLPSLAVFAPNKAA